MAYLGDNGLSKVWTRMKSYINERVEAFEQGVTMELVWTNASPTSAFSAQVINLDLSEYDLIKILFKGWAQYEYSIFEMEVAKNSKGRLGAPMDYNWNRDVATTNSSIIFATAKGYGTYGKTTTVDNDQACVPIAIYGIKGVK